MDVCKSVDCDKTTLKAFLFLAPKRRPLDRESLLASNNDNDTRADSSNARLYQCQIVILIDGGDNQDLEFHTPAIITCHLSVILRLANRANCGYATTFQDS